MLIGITGGVATGKSSLVRSLVGRHPFRVFDADQCVHRLLANDEPTAAALRQTFGAKCFNSQGEVCRIALRELVFHDRDALRHLEKILHPLVRHQCQEIRAACLVDEVDFLADIPLLYETEASPLFHAIVVVAASAETRQDRLKARGLSHSTTEAMLASQWPIGEKMHRATFVAWNDGTLEELDHQADFLIENLFPFKA